MKTASRVARYAMELVFILILLMVGLLLWRSDWRFLLQQQLNRSHPLPLTQVDDQELNLALKDLQAFLEEDKVTVDQSLLLINGQNPLPDDFVAEVAEYKTSGVVMNSCIQKAYAELAQAVQQHCGEKLYVMSAYRTADEQAEILDESDPDTAAGLGESEHQSGLALDVYTTGYAGDAFLKSKAGQYVYEHCEEYGFILRYPQDKQDITGIRFEPWHIRYVGAPHAKIMQTNGWTLEEYLQKLELGTFYEADGYLVCRQKGDCIEVPKGGTAYRLSQDNQGGYILTVKMP